MKTLIKSMAITSLFMIFTSSAFSQQVLVSDISVTPRWVQDPGISGGSYIVRGTNAQDRWLQVDVDASPRFSSRQVHYSKETRAPKAVKPAPKDSSNPSSPGSGCASSRIRRRANRTDGDDMLPYSEKTS
jgi:hypothetical protein